MTDKDAIDMAQRCIEEIKMQRAQLTALAPKAEAYDLIHKIIGLIPPASQGYGEDIVWRLEKQIEKLQAKPVDDR